MADNTSPLASLEENLDLYFGQKAPPMPPNIKELIVKFAPWVILFILLITLPAVLIALGLGALAAPLAFLGGPGYGVSYGVTYVISMLVLAVSIVFEALSIPGLFNRTRQGWQYAYYATLVSIAGSLIRFNIVGAIISGLIGFYILFQIKPYYGRVEPVRT